MTGEGELYKPGDAVPESGVYGVLHDSLDGHTHAHPHEVTAIRGMLFPPCRACQANVRFRLHHTADHIDVHDLFRR